MILQSLISIALLLGATAPKTEVIEKRHPNGKPRLTREVRVNERGTQIGSGWDPQWHQPTDVFTTYTDKDFRLGLNAAQTTLSAVAGLTGAALKK